MKKITVIFSLLLFSCQIYKPQNESEKKEIERYIPKDTKYIGTWIGYLQTEVNYITIKDTLNINDSNYEFSGSHFKDGQNRKGNWRTKRNDRESELLLEGDYVFGYNKADNYLIDTYTWVRYKKEDDLEDNLRHGKLILYSDKEIITNNTDGIDRQVLNKFLGLWKSNESTEKIGEVITKSYYEIKFYWDRYNPNILTIDFYSFNDLMGAKSGNVGYFYLNQNNNFTYAVWLDQWGIAQAKWSNTGDTITLKENYVYFSTTSSARELLISGNSLVITAFNNGGYMGKFDLKKTY